MSRPARAIVLPSLCGALLLLGACQTATQRKPVPALLSSTDAATTAELNAAASKLLNGKPVTLGRSAFTNNSGLTLETAMRNSALGRIGSGRIIEEPDGLRLLRAGRRCVLEHVNSGKQTRLKLTNCIVAPATNTTPAQD